MFAKSVSGYSWMEFVEKRHGVNESAQTMGINQRLNLAVEYIESQCTTKFGFLTQVSTDLNLSEAKIAIPNTFDTAVIMDVLQTAGVDLSPEVKDSVKNLLIRHRNSDQLWNYFHSDYMVIPDDVDATSNAVLGLLASGLEKEEVAKMATTVFKKAVIHEDGLVDVYFPKPVKCNGVDVNGNGVNGNATNGHSLRSPVVQKWPVSRRIDLGVTANFLLLLCKAGINHLPQLEECYHLLEKALDAILERDYENAVISSYAKNYNNLDVICFFISRLIPESAYARNLLLEKLAKIMEERLQLPNSDSLSMACRILAGINSGLLEKPESQVQILKETEKLLDSQKRENFSFPKVGLYNAHKRFHFGSSALSTALAVAAIATTLKSCPSFNGNNSKIVGKFAN